MARTKRKSSSRRKGRSGISINPANKGKLRKTAKAKKGRKIPVKKLQQMKRSKNPKTRKRATFALNARKWRKGGRKKR
jgi:oligoendopeptidase F